MTPAMFDKPGPRGAVAVEWSLAESASWKGKKPDAATVALYFEPCVRNGKPLGISAGNWCAAGACCAAANATGTTDLESKGIPHSYRAAGKELEDDAKRLGAWLDRAAAKLEHLRPGDIVILNRGDPGGWQRHVSRLVGITPDGKLDCIDANGFGAAWTRGVRTLTNTSIRGFILYPRGGAALTTSAADVAPLVVGAGLVLGFL